MNFNFYKYQGTGNDFIIIDNRKLLYKFSSNEISIMCSRKFGIGSDGVILIKKHKEYDFEMVYYNSDGSCSFCGNGSRCAVHFANYIGLIKNNAKFLSNNKYCEATINDKHVKISISEVQKYKILDKKVLINTGSPHLVCFDKRYEYNFDIIKEVNNIKKQVLLDINNVNYTFAFLNKTNKTIFARTFERGVENETLSCGSAAIATAIASYILFHGIKHKQVKMPGGLLNVEFDADKNKMFKNIFLSGKVEQVFKGIYSY